MTQQKHDSKNNLMPNMESVDDKMLNGKRIFNKVLKIEFYKANQKLFYFILK
jgi:hypothetical protein